MTQPVAQLSSAPIAASAAYQEELSLPRAWFALTALPTVAALVRRHRASRDSVRGMPAARVVVQTAISAALLCYFSTLRIVVQGGTLTVGFRRLAESIPLQRITSCGPTTYHWLTWGGYGIRIRPHARMYNLPSDRGRAVRLTLDDGREVFFSSADPDAVCAAVRAGQVREMETKETGGQNHITDMVPDSSAAAIPSTDAQAELWAPQDVAAEMSHPHPHAIAPGRDR